MTSPRWPGSYLPLDSESLSPAALSGRERLAAGELPLFIQAHLRGPSDLGFSFFLTDASPSLSHGPLSSWANSVFYEEAAHFLSFLAASRGLPLCSSMEDQRFFKNASDRIAQIWQPLALHAFPFLIGQHCPSLAGSRISTAPVHLFSRDIDSLAAAGLSTTFIQTGVELSVDLPRSMSLADAESSLRSFHSLLLSLGPTVFPSSPEDPTLSSISLYHAHLARLESRALSSQSPSSSSTASRRGSL